MAVASGSDRRVVERELDQLGLRGSFPVIVTARDVPRSKPFPDLFLRAAGEMGVRPDRCSRLRRWPEWARGGVGRRHGGDLHPNQRAGLGRAVSAAADESGGGEYG